jgi:DNA-binding beta-propeller fold protein YncE
MTMVQGRINGTSGSRLVRFFSVLIVTLLLAPTISSAQVPQMVGPLRLTESPLGLVTGDYVGGPVQILDPTTLEITDALPIYTDETLVDRGKPLSVGWMNNRLYVGEERTGLIQVFEKSSGKKNPKSKGGKKSSGWVQVSASLTTMTVVQPSAIVADESLGLLFVASKGEQAVLVLDEAGNLVRTIGEPGAAVSLGNPQAIALDRAGQRVFVSDDGIEKCGSLGCSMLAGIQIYDYSGLPLGTINGNTGNAGYKFSRAQGVALDVAGRVYLADSYRHQVMVFEETTPNTFSALGLLGNKGAGPGQLLLPTGVYISTATSGIYVANTMLARIEVFGMEDLVQ